MASLKLKDVRLVKYDFANAEANALKAVRVEFLNCPPDIPLLYL
jgi:hypothetical protein